MRRIVLTGGPGSGKTVLASLLACQRPDRFICVPEAATRVYTDLGTRRDLLDIAGRRDVQRRIYRLQRLQEEQIADDAGKVVLLDRGTVDGAAYWPDGYDDYWAHLGAARDVELARYDAVVWLQTSAAIGLYAGRASNSVRTEDGADAVVTGEKLLHAWAGHARLVRVNAFVDWKQKVAEVSRVVDELIEGFR